MLWSCVKTSHYNGCYEKCEGSMLIAHIKPVICLGGNVRESSLLEFEPINITAKLIIFLGLSLQEKHLLFVHFFPPKQFGRDRMGQIDVQMFCIYTYLSVISWGTMLQAGMSRVRFPMSLDFSIDLMYFQRHYGPGVDSASNRN
jgi:hypothetical protein